ncbi:hypothetical protein A6A04_10520 [Paramagnetospirillum marisnigri]|uniref:Uncharacterized protein n=1 Tax=Paramagnetospirillum marisnigri TaxID=1285242 RepID=A0A178MXZ5_9PROT|nr:hypothetical protein [Paramagnetospirillum marisnigri]OAN55985.1 hypothetical protein A6A04_10520 [Paramagnetospirillum marisnigri]
MFKFALALAVTLIAVPMTATAAEDPAEVEATVAGIKAANPDLKSLCMKGVDGIRAAARDSVTALAMAGKIKGNPQAVAGEAGQKVGAECRG